MIAGVGATIDPDEVGALIRAVGDEVLLPRFERLAAHEVWEKSAGEVVTVADHEAELALARRLGALHPGLPVVGEEAAAADPAVVRGLRRERAWLVDPIDGTAAFAAGDPTWAVMVTLVERGQAVTSWILHPVTGRLFMAERGAGATADGVRIVVDPAARPLGPWRAAILTGFMDPETRSAVTATADRLGLDHGGRRSAGHDYPAIALGRLDFGLWWRTLPWDHAPGSLLVEEAGGTVGRPDGSPFLPLESSVTGDGPRGLIAASDPDAWAAARALLPGSSLGA